MLMQRRLALTLLCLAGVALNTWITCNYLVPGAWKGKNDFLGLYAGARLAGTSRLYDPEAARETQLREAGETLESQRFIRLPYYALMLKPVGLLPYRPAYGVWLALSVLSLAIFAALWPAGTTGWLICCWFLPGFVAVFNGQDAPMLLLWVALAVYLTKRDRQFAAGMVLALCASKYHLAILLPFVVLAQGRWRMLAGSLVAGAAMLAVSFGVAGRRWPWEYADVVTDPRIHPSVIHMPSFHGMQIGTPLQILMTLLVVLCVVVTARCASFEWGLAIALAAGVLVGFHTYLADCVIFLPAIIQAIQVKALRLPSIALATPVPWLLLQLPPPQPNLTRALMLMLVIGIAVTRRGSEPVLDEILPQEAANPAGEGR